jgi:hypothetical protein
VTTTDWPALPYADWRDTLETIHMWSQIVGKMRLALAPPVNHTWHVTLPVTARGLTTGSLPHGSRFFQVDFDFVAHVCRIVVSDGREKEIPLRPMTVADFHKDLTTRLAKLGLAVDIWTLPVEVADPIRFDEDRTHASYDPEAVTRFFHALARADAVLKTFRGGFIGKSSPVHFFWGSFDLAVTRFSGRSAPEHPGGIPNHSDSVTREAYSHELFSAGWWPGSDVYPEPAFYAYAYPEPDGFPDASVPTGALYHAGMRNFVLPWAVVRAATDPERAVLDFLETTYAAAADLGKWDRDALERQ